MDNRQIRYSYLYKRISVQNTMLDLGIDEQKRQLGARPELIPLQTKVCTDIYNILCSLGYDAQTPNNVAISTVKGEHIINYYPFNIIKTWGYYKNYLPPLKIKTDYKFEDLENYIKTYIADILKG